MGAAGTGAAASVTPEDLTAAHPRRPGWELRLAAAVEAARGRPFRWGQHDCAIWAFDLRRDLTGGEDVAALWRGRYRTHLGGQRMMRRLGWKSLEEAGRALLGAPLPSVSFAQRGDLVLTNSGIGFGGGFGVCLGALAAGIAPSGLNLAPIAATALAWRI